VCVCVCVEYGTFASGPKKNIAHDLVENWVLVM
jgi:hypothetical protein